LKATVRFEVAFILGCTCGTDSRPKTPDPTMRIDEGRGAGSDCITLWSTVVTDQSVQ